MTAQEHKIIVEQALVERLTARGLSPRRGPLGVTLDFPGLDAPGVTLAPGSVQALKRPFSRTPKFYVSVEINATLGDPATSRAVISDSVSTEGPTAEEALTQGVDAYLAVTFPALWAVVDRTAYTGPNLRITTGRVNGEVEKWQVFTGECQVLQDVTGEIAQHLKASSPLPLLQDALVQFLNVPRLHWCKLYGARTPLGMSFGCVVDGRKSAEAEAEMRRKLGSVGPPRARWEFRQFFTFLPSSEADQ